MASTPEYVAFILEQLSKLENITTRKMMGETIVYCGGKVVGGIYDNRFLLKPTPKAMELTHHPALELPYPGAKAMLLVNALDDKEYLTRLVQAVYEELPETKQASGKKLKKNH